MGKDALGGTDEVVTSGGVSSEGHDEGSGVGQGDLLGDGGPPDDWGALEAEKEKEAPAEALTTAALVQLGAGPGGGKVERSLVRWGL